MRDVHFVGDTDSDEKIVRYCSNCIMYGDKVKLVNRILREGEKMGSDWDYYLQCPICGQLEPKEKARIESDISDVVEKNDSDSGYAISLDDPKLRRGVREYKIIRWD